MLGKRDSIVAYTGDTSRIGSPCVDALVDDGTVVEALTFDTAADCQSDIVDNVALVNASVEVCACRLLLLASFRQKVQRASYVQEVTGHDKRGFPSPI